MLEGGGSRFPAGVDAGRGGARSGIESKGDSGGVDLETVVAATAVQAARDSVPFLSRRSLRRAIRQDGRSPPTAIGADRKTTPLGGGTAVRWRPRARSAVIIASSTLGC